MEDTQSREEVEGNEFVNQNGDSDSEEGWMDEGFGGGLTGAGEILKRGLWLLRFRAAPKPFSHKDKHNPREAEGGAADVRSLRSCG